MIARVDTAALRRRHPLPDLLARYGLPLRRCGRALVGRCPFHDDRGRPNLYVYPDSERWRCYRCDAGGDVIAFVQRIEGLGFLDAVRRLEGVTPPSPPARLRASPLPWPARSRRPGAEELACLDAAVELYHRRLLSEPRALTYLAQRGIAAETIAECRLGFAAGDELAPYLRWRGLPLGAALNFGLLHRSFDRLAGRIVIPELRHGRAIWAIGRALGADDAPPYLGLPGPKPLLGWEGARGAASVILVEGAFDWLALRQWGYPALALLGTHASPEALASLRRLPSVDLLLDGDDAGRAATLRLAAQLGARARVRSLPRVKDVGDLARRPDGRAIFAASFGDPAAALAA